MTSLKWIWVIVVIIIATGVYYIYSDRNVLRDIKGEINSISTCTNDAQDPFGDHFGMPQPAYPRQIDGFYFDAHEDLFEQRNTSGNFIYTFDSLLDTQKTPLILDVQRFIAPVRAPDPNDHTATDDERVVITLLNASSKYHKALFRESVVYTAPYTSQYRYYLVDLTTLKPTLLGVTDLNSATPSFALNPNGTVCTIKS